MKTGHKTSGQGIDLFVGTNTFTTLRGLFTALMEDLGLVSSALLAYASAVLTEEGAVSKSVNSVEDALSGAVLLAVAGIE